MPTTTRRSVLLLGAAAVGSAREAAVEIEVVQDLPPLQFAAAGIRRELARKRIPVRKNAPVRIVLSVGPGGAEEQAYTIRKQSACGRTVFAAEGAGPAGAMYAGLDLAEAIRLGTLSEFENVERTPHIARRGIKFNIPLDARTPSYSDAGDAAQQNIQEMWSMAFRREFLDEMGFQEKLGRLIPEVEILHPYPEVRFASKHPW